MMNDVQYIEEVERWRAEQDASLRAEDGWLAVAGLFWLSEGEQSVGAGEQCDLVLPGGPERLGALVRQGQQVIFRPAPGSGALVNGEPAGERELRAEDQGQPDLVKVGSLTLFVIRRGERVGIRLRDTQAARRLGFSGRQWYPVQPQYRVAARFTPYEEPRTVLVPNVLGDVEERQASGFVTFTLAGREHTLVPTSAGERLFFILRDLTSGHSTYGMGRFLYTDGPRAGTVTLDFNRLYSPPCAFTDYATCPMPPRENHLDVAIEAGELYSGH